MTDFRQLPPVEPVEWPARLSQTLLRFHDRCPRSAYLAAKYANGPSSHAMDRGSAFHLFAERMVVDLIQNNEASLFAPQFGEDVTRAKEEVASLTATMVDEVLSEHPELVVPAQDADAVRRMAYHLAVGLDVDPDSVVGVERKFVLDLECGWTVSGKVDLASLPEATRGQVDDFKTSLHVPEEESSPFQRKTYAVLLVYGQPVEDRECARCRGTGEAGHFTVGEPVDPVGGLVVLDEHGKPKAVCVDCEGRGKIEHRLDPIGGHLRAVTGRELYPRYTRKDGSIQRLEKTWTRLELEEFRQDMERAGRQLTERLETWDFPARSGPHCSECPAEPECPLPRHLRRWAGAIQEEVQAAEAWAWAERMDVRVKQARKEVKAWAKANDVGVRVGDFLWEFTVKTRRKLRTKPDRTSDWDGLELAVRGAVEHGDPFDLRDWIREGKSNEWAKRSLDPEAVSPAKVLPLSDEDLDERYGADAPF